jgi:hypothetical protein
LLEGRTWDLAPHSHLGITTSGQLLAGVPRNVPRRLSVRERVREFLEGFLRDGPRTARDIWAAALPLGFTERTLERVKQELAIRSIRAYAEGHRHSYWLLPGQELPKNVYGIEFDVNNWLAERCPPRTPLDDM